MKFEDINIGMQYKVIRNVACFKKGETVEVTHLGYSDEAGNVKVKREKSIGWCISSSDLEPVDKVPSDELENRLSEIEARLKALEPKSKVEFKFGDKVRLLVDNPDGNSRLFKGDIGVYVCLGSLGRPLVLWGKEVNTSNGLIDEMRQSVEFNQIELVEE